MYEYARSLGIKAAREGGLATNPFELGSKLADHWEIGYRVGLRA